MTDFLRVLLHFPVSQNGSKNGTAFIREGAGCAGRTPTARMNTPGGHDGTRGARWRRCTPRPRDLEIGIQERPTGSDRKPFGSAMVENWELRTIFMSLEKKDGPRGVPSAAEPPPRNPVGRPGHVCSPAAGP